MDPAQDSIKHKKAILQSYLSIIYSFSKKTQISITSSSASSSKSSSSNSCSQINFH